MPELKSKSPAKKKNPALRKLVGTVIVAGATYAAEKFLESQDNKRRLAKKVD